MLDFVNTKINADTNTLQIYAKKGFAGMQNANLDILKHASMDIGVNFFSENVVFMPTRK